MFACKERKKIQTYVRRREQADFAACEQQISQRRRAQYLRTKRGFAFFCLQEPIYKVLVIFFVMKLGVFVRLVKSELILSFYLSKQ